MPLQALIFIALRFYSIYFFFQFLPSIPVLVFYFLQLDSSPGRWLTVVVAVVWLLMALALWFLAGPLSKRIWIGATVPVNFEITLEGALALAFVFLGLVFVLSSIGSTLVELGSLIQTTSEFPQGSEMRTRAATDFYRPAITFAAGMGSIFGSSKWSRLLATRKAKAS